MKHGLLNPTLKSAAAFKHCPLVHHNDSLKLHQHDWLIPWWIQCPQLCGADCYNLQQNPHGAYLLLWHLHGYLWDNSCGFDEIHKSLCFHSFSGQSVVKTDVLMIAWLRKYTTSRGTLTACCTDHKNRFSFQPSDFSENFTFCLRREHKYQDIFSWRSFTSIAGMKMIHNEHVWEFT